MIKEDYVSFEIAKLLKEKGFNEPTLAYAYGDNMIGYYSKPKITDPLCIEAGRIPMPTIQMAMKWLREVHNIEIAISYGIIFDRNTLKQVFKYFWSIVKVNGLCLEFPMNTPGDVCNKEIEANSYEEAVEAAIKYVLENLI